MQMPRLHINGTSRDVLLEQYSEAIYALNDAITALRSIDVNGRDYYTISPDAGAVALAEHRARVAALENIWEDMSSIAEHICTTA